MEMIPARYAKDANAQGFVANDEFYYPSCKYLHRAFAHYTLLEILGRFSVCVVAEMSFVLSKNRHKAPLTIANSLRTAPDTHTPSMVSPPPELPSIHIYRTKFSLNAEGDDQD
jgi:hypothetical protein